MLPVPKLDNRTFQEMMQEATKRIPRLYDTWTDENVHDPGITMLEMLTWLVEMQQFYIDQVSEKHELKFLKLMGEAPKPVQKASVMVTFDSKDAKGMIPPGTKLTAREEVFETVEPVTVSPMRLERIIVRTDEEANDYTSSNHYSAVDFPAFGSRPKPGNQLYIAFTEPIEKDEEALLYFDLYDDYPVQREPVTDEDPFYPSAKMEWFIYGEKDGVTDWHPLQVTMDETKVFTFSGRFRFLVDVDMVPTVVYPAERKASCWISAVLDESAFEVPPFIRHMSIHTIEAMHRFTFSKATVYAMQDGEVRANDALSYRGDLDVQLELKTGGWVSCEAVPALLDEEAGPYRYTVTKDDRMKETRITFPTALQEDPELSGRVQIIGTEPSFSRDRWIGESTGLPYQQLDIHPLVMAKEDFVLQIGTHHPRTGVYMWENWTRVDDFDHSSAYDTHFHYDQARNLITFGDHEQGRAPFPSDHRNIRIVSAHTGGTEVGNIKPGVIDGLVNKEAHLPDVTVTNHVYGTGGAEAESVERVKNRLQRDWQDSPGAVSLEDLEILVKKTPGLRVARAHILPLFEEGMKLYPERKREGVLTVVVLPFSHSDRPMPSDGFLKTVEAWLNRHRLISTKVAVIAPVYIRITVHVVVVVRQQAASLGRDVQALLRQVITSFQTGAQGEGWVFGRPVKKADLIGLVSQVPGLVYVQDLWIDAEGRGMKKDSHGNVILPPHGLVYSGDHEVEVLIDEHV